MYFKKLILCSCAAFLGTSVTAQRSLVSVNHTTGTANVVIPLDKIENGNISVPVSLVYSNNGIKVDESPGNAGLGWQLVAGGQISRTLRGLPDDVKKNKTGISRVGWLYNSNGTKIQNFNIANDNSSATCADEQADLAYINANFGDFSDTEPDIFTLSAPGLNCQFAFDKDHTIRTIPYQDVEITYEQDPITQLIESFSVINDKGTKYLFSKTLKAGKAAGNLVTGSHVYLPLDKIVYFRQAYDLFSQGEILYNSDWLLSSITDINGNQVYFNYQDLGTGYSESQFFISSGNETEAGIERGPLYINGRRKSYQKLLSISSGSKSIGFEYNSINDESRTLVSSIRVHGGGSSGYQYLFNYENSYFSSGGLKGYRSRFLMNLTTDQCNSPVNYYFTYENKTTAPSPSGSYFVVTDEYPIDTAYYYPRSDLWGYPAHLSMAAFLPVDTASVKGGMLKQIQYYNGGSTTFTYESNNFYNPVSKQVENGGGVRIRSIADFDGLDNSRNLVRKFSYTHPTTGITSGAPVSLPVRGFKSPNKNIGIPKDLSETDHTIMYTHVRESQDDIGSTLYEYAVPATAWSDTTSQGDWFPPRVYAARKDCAISLGRLLDTKMQYPFAPETNYDFERGLLKAVTKYDNGGKKVSEAVYQYKRSFPAVRIDALRFDDNEGVKMYAKYSLIASTSKVISQVTSTIFDVAANTPGQQTITQYIYGGTGHTLPTVIETVNSDGTRTRVNHEYTKDYTAGLGNNTSLQLLQQKHINTPYQSYTQVKQLGSSVWKTTAANLIKYGAFPGVSNGLQGTDNVNILPATSLFIATPDGLNDFVPSVNGDPRYIVAESFHNYDPTGYLRHSSDRQKRVQTTFRDSVTHLPLAVFTNAAPAEVAFSNFNGYRAASEVFTISSSNYTNIADRAGDYALNFGNGVTLTKSVTKRAVVKNYRLTVWIKAQQAGSLTITTSGNQSLTLPYQAAAESWKYYELKLPVSGLPEKFSVSVQAPAGVAVDDLLFYPEVAEVTTYQYDPVTRYKTAETNTNGVATYYTNDKFGRTTLVYDQDKQITYRKTFHYEDTDIYLPEPIFYVMIPPGEKDTLYTRTGYDFATSNIYNVCRLPGVTFSWDYGDGSAPTSTFTHTYLQPGKFDVKLTVTVPGVGTRTWSDSLKVVDRPPQGIRFAYVNNTAASGIKKVDVLQNGQLIRSFTPTSLYSGSLPKGDYTIKVYCYGEDTGISVTGELDTTRTCYNWVHANVYTFSGTIRNVFSIYLNATSCEEQ